MSRAPGGSERLDPEVLAAFMEGRLSEEERARVLAHLVASPEDLEVLGDAAAALGALAEEDGDRRSPEKGSPPTPGERRATLRWKVWLPLAAVLAGVAVVPSVLQRAAAPSLTELRPGLVVLGPRTLPTDLPPASGADPVRSGSAETAFLTDSVAPAGRAFLRGVAAARLTVLAPDARVMSPAAGDLGLLLRSASGAAARPAVEAWYARSVDDEASWTSIMRVRESGEGEPAAFRLGMLVERISLALSLGAGQLPGGAATDLRGAFAALPRSVRADLRREFEAVMAVLEASPPDAAAVTDRLGTFARAAATLGSAPPPSR